MPRRRAPALLSIVIAFGCAHRKDEAAPAPVVEHEPAPTGDQFAFVSTDNNQAAEGRVVEEGQGEIAGDFAVKSPDAAKEIAEAAVADRLDKKKTWRTSPVLPTSWPASERAVAVYFYPMAANPHSLEHFQLFSAAYRVDVSLVDGTTKVLPIAKPKMIGTVTDTRPTSLERRELEIAESALVRQLLGADIASGENNYWGYLKFMHEHPEIGRDIEKRAGPFVKWVKHKD
jgi:hypothetical protein